MFDEKIHFGYLDIHDSNNSHAWSNNIWYLNDIWWKSFHFGFLDIRDSNDN